MRILARLGAVLLWVFQVLLALLFVLAGYIKFVEPMWARNFARWGYPDGFYLVIGVLEMLGGLSLLVPRLASYGASLLGVIMIAAALTHAIHGETARLTPPLVFSALLAVLGTARWRSAMRLTPPRRPPAGFEPV
jgi:putative oxidoreductase